jgi:hypothetical protein
MSSALDKDLAGEKERFFRVILLTSFIIVRCNYAKKTLH